MKTQLTSVDLCVMAQELNSILCSGRIDKVYQIGRKELKLRVHVSGAGSMELIIAPGYVCLTQFPRETPREPSSFAMQLRKNLKGGFIREVRQHSFDRILEFVIETKEKKFILITEFFSRGNVILCSSEKKIIGLLEWQKWRDRKLGVGQVYEHPPETRNPFEIDYPSFKEILSSERKLVVVLAVDAGLSGVYAEEVCLLSGIDKSMKGGELSSDEINTLFNSFKKMRDKIKGEIKPSVILREGAPVDAVPFDLKVYEGLEKKSFKSFNEAVDEYFSEEEFNEVQRGREEKFLGELRKLSDIEEKQKEVIEKLEEKTVEYRKIGDLIYQNFQSIDKVLKVINEGRKKGISWGSIEEKYGGKEFNGIRIEEINNQGFIVLSTVLNEK
ncbi:MAG: NFACT family protein [Candidatus Altiarchaeota archaeon]|nr:NFACT family protein [Candidatus Altiarchaeota archaeon]